MKISKAKAAENRAKVLDAAARLFREKGFEAVAVADLMREAGLTHGGFYNHFGSKGALEAEACAHAFGPAVDRVSKLADEPEGPSRGAALAAFIAKYLSPSVRDATAVRCPMAAFAADVARQGEPVQEAYAKGLRAYLDAFAKSFGADCDERARDDAVATMSALVGTLVMARSVARVDPALSDDLLAASRRALSRKLAGA